MFDRTERGVRRRRRISAPLALVLTVLVAMIAIGPLTPATSAIAGAVTFVGLVDADLPSEPSAADTDDDLLVQLLAQVQQVQEEEEDFHTREPLQLTQPAVSARPAATGPLVAESDAMSARLSRPPRA